MDYYIRRIRTAASIKHEVGVMLERYRAFTNLKLTFIWWEIDMYWRKQLKK